MELKDRLATVIKVNNHSASSFADLIGVQRSSISHILNGRNNPSLDFIVKVLEAFPRVDPRWLITGVAPENSLNENTGFDEVGNEQEKKTTRPLPNISADKKIDKIVVFYTDRTFEEYGKSKS